MAIVLGIDPGGAATGMVLRERDTVHAHAVIERRKLTELAYLRAVADAIAPLAGQIDHVAVEGLVAPSTHIGGKKQLIKPEHVMNVSVAYGYVLSLLVHVLDLEPIIVRPDGHGSRHEALSLDVRRLYPAELIGPREGPAGTGILRHARSAWDIAGTVRAIRPGQVR